MSLQNAEIVTRASRLVNASCQSGVAGEELLSLCGPGIRIDASRRVFNPDAERRGVGDRSLSRPTELNWLKLADGMPILILPERRSAPQPWSPEVAVRPSGHRR
jgi:hypothetical protein